MSTILPSFSRRLCVSCLLACLASYFSSPVRAQSRPAPLSNAPLPRRVHGAEALQALGNRLGEIATFHRLPESELRRRLQQDKALWVDPRGRLLYICEFEPPNEGPVGESTNTPPIAPLYALTQTFKLHSRPGAIRTIYLDFDGHDASATSWGSDGNLPVARPYDTDGSSHVFSNAERAAIQYIWARVAEDFLHYDIDVTTEDPGVSALKNTGNGRYGVRVVVGGDSSDWYGSAGGVAYLNSFDDNQDLPCWVFPKSLGDSEKNIAEACSHEAGHTLGLAHDGQTTGVEYYTGHGNWAPIMGVGYSRSIVQWSQGEYANANNTEDDLTRMLSYGAINRPDDHGNNLGTASELTGVRPFAWGIIGNRSDVDYFRFEAGAGRTTITATPAPRGPNLRIQLSLYDGTGSLILSSNVADNVTSGTQPVTISLVLPAGGYYVSVDGTGFGNPLSTGYSDYSSLGQYTLLVTLPGDGTWAETDPGDYSWNDSANWTSATTPYGLSATARINNDISGDQNIQVDAAVTLGRLLVGDANSTHSFSLQTSGAGVLRFGTTNGSAEIVKTSGLQDTLTVPMQLLTNLLVTNATSADLVLAGGVDGPFDLTKHGSGRLLLGGAMNLNQIILAEGTGVLGDTTSLAGVGAIQVHSNAVLDVSTLTGGWSLPPTLVLGGNGVVTGEVSVAAGSRLAPALSGSPGTLAFTNQLTFLDGAALTMRLGAETNAGVGVNDLIAVAGNLTLDGVTTITFDFGSSLPDTNGAYTILTYGGTLTGGASNLVAATGGRRFGYVFDDSVPGEIRVHVFGAPELLTWVGDDVVNVWDVAGATNWSRAGVPDAFFQGDSVFFGDGSTVPGVNLTGVLSPAQVTVSNMASLAFSGGGLISGNTALLKQGGGVLTVATSNNFAGTTMIEDGTLAMGHPAALGLMDSGTFITNTGQLDLKGNTIGLESLTVSGDGPSGNGAIVNTGGDQTNALRRLTLAGDATIGGSGRWDLRSVPASNITASLTGNGFALTKTGPNQVWLANLGSLSVGNITVNQGTFGFEGATIISPGSATLTVNPGATLAFRGMFDSDFNRTIALNSATVQNDIGHNILMGPMILTGTNLVSVGEAATLDARAAVSGGGGFAKSGVGILRLAGANTFAGHLAVSAGTVMAGHNAALGSIAGSTTIASGARLDVAGFNLGAEEVFVGGSGINNRGAIVNSTTSAQAYALRFVTLTANTTLGGIGRWDIRGNPTGSLLGAFDLTKVADNEIWLANLGTTQLRNITVSEGTLGFQGTTTMGNAANTVSVSSGGTLAINGTGTNVLSKNSITLSNARLINTAGSNVFSGTLSLSSSNQLDTATGTTLLLNGSVSGSGFFNKTSAGTLILGGTAASTGLNRVSAGTLQIGADGVIGSLSGNLTNLGALVFNRRTDLSHAGIIAGTGTITKQNTNTLTLSAANTYSGLTTVSAGTLRMGNASALGSVGAGTTVTSGGTLDLNGFSVGTEAITVNGAGAGGKGAVVNTGPSQINAIRTLNLTGNTTLGGSNRWDVRATSGQGTLGSAGQPHGLTKVGPNTIGLNNVNVDPALGNVFVLQGELSVEQVTTGLGNPASSVTVSSNATLTLYSLAAPLNKGAVLADGGKLSHNGPGSGGVNSTLSGLLTLSNGMALVENLSPLYSLQLNSTVTGAGGLNKLGNGLVQLNAVNDYTGNTIVSAGTLKLGPSAGLAATPFISIADGAVFDVSSLGGGFVLAAGQGLGGNGSVLGNVIANGTISPGTSIGKLTLTGNLMLAGNTAMELTKSGSLLTNDILSVSGALTCGGTLVVTHTGTALAANDSFHLFSAGAFTGSFANYSLPTLASGLAWDTSTVNADGWLRVVSNSVPVFASVSLVGGDLVIAGSGGTPGATYHVLTTTNVARPMSEWLPVATNVFDAGGNFAFTNAVSLDNQQQFFRLDVP